MVNRTPFDERGNENIKITDISRALILDYQQKVNSHFVKLLLHMNLQVGLIESLKLRRHRNHHLGGYLKELQLFEGS